MFTLAVFAVSYATPREQIALCLPFQSFVAVTFVRFYLDSETRPPKGPVSGKPSNWPSRYSSKHLNFTNSALTHQYGARARHGFEKSLKAWSVLFFTITRERVSSNELYRQQGGSFEDLVLDVSMQGKTVDKVWKASAVRESVLTAGQSTHYLGKTWTTCRPYRVPSHSRSSWYSPNPSCKVLHKTPFILLAKRIILSRLV